MRFGLQWEQLPETWSAARIRVALDDPDRTDRAAQLLGPLQPLRAAPGMLTFRLDMPTERVKRLLERLDAERIEGALELVALDPTVLQPPAPEEPSLRESWEAALATAPPDWTDLLAEVELYSSDWLDPASVAMTPINPCRDGARLAFRFRSARRFGYGAAPGMVARCLARCDEAGIHGTVRVLRALSSTDAVGTQGPVWQIDGRTV